MNNQNYKVLLICPSMVVGGVERRVGTLAKYLPRNGMETRVGLLRREGLLLQELAPKQLLHVEPPAWLGLVLAPLRPWKTLHGIVAAVHQVAVLIRRTRPDMVVTFTLEATLPLALRLLFAAKGAKKKVLSGSSRRTATRLRPFSGWCGSAPWSGACGFGSAPLTAKPIS